MKKFEIAVYPGDGIGPEVVDQALRVLQALEHLEGGFSLTMTTLPWGARHYEETGNVVPGDFLNILCPFDAIFLGAVGWPHEIPDHITLAPLVRIRQAFDQYACVRPSRLYPGVRSVLAGKQPGDVDLVVIRENSEGEYVDNGGRFRRGQSGEVAVQTALHTRRGIERVLRYGFEMARGRRKHLTMATKSNAQAYAYVLWDEVLFELAEQYPDVEAERQHCDAAIMNLVRQPERFDVIVASNLFGDLLTDLAGVIGGGLGLAPSTNTNPEGTYPSMFEPVHGSAPGDVGRGVANPIAAMLSAALMLEHLGLEGPAARLRLAVKQTLAEGSHTPDLGGTLTTQQVGDAVLRNLK